MGEVKIERLEDLWDSGAVYLPNIATQYSEAASGVHQSAAWDHIFERSEGGKSPLFSSFNALRSTFQDKVLVESCNNCVTSGKVLTQIVDSFATQDNLNSTELEDFKDYKNPDKRYGEEKPPPKPDPPKSSDEVPDPDK